MLSVGLLLIVVLALSCGTHFCLRLLYCLRYDRQVRLLYFPIAVGLGFTLEAIFAAGEANPEPHLDAIFRDVSKILALTVLAHALKTFIWLLIEELSRRRSHTGQ
jgi:hypothetical protein